MITLNYIKRKWNGGNQLDQATKAIEIIKLISDKYKSGTANLSYIYFLFKGIMLPYLNNRTKTIHLANEQHLCSIVKHTNFT